jgi:tetratricopeptide (TPR) repeat protein
MCFLFIFCGGWLSCALANIQPDVGSQDFIEVLDIEAEEPEAYLGMAAEQMTRGEAAAVLATIDQGLARYPDDPTLLERKADILATQTVLRSRAAVLYRRLLAEQPGNLALKNKLAYTLLAIRQIGQAEKLFQEVLTAEPDNADAHLGLGRLYLRSAFYPLAELHFEKALSRLPENGEARQGLKEARDLTTPQLQTLAGHLEDAEGFRRSFVYGGYRVFLHPRVRLYGGYGYIAYDSGAGPFQESNRGKALHRHVLPLILQYRPIRTLLMEVGGALSDYARWGQSGTARLSAYWQATPRTGLSASYSYYDVIDFLGPFRGPWGLYFDDFAGYTRYRYNIVNPIGLWSQSFFGAGASNTLAVTQKIRTNDVILWGYQTLWDRVSLIGFGNLSFHTDGNLRRILGAGLQYRVLREPLIKAKYLFVYIDYRRRAAELTPLDAAAAYFDPQALKLHSWGIVLENNWSGRVK